MRPILSLDRTAVIFGSAVCLSVMLHLLLFNALILTAPGSPAQYAVNVSFLGSLLRKSDFLQPALALRGEAASDVIWKPSRIAGIFQAKAVALGVVVDKPLMETLNDLSGQNTEPSKFLTERVEPEEPSATDIVPKAPEAPRMKLRISN